MKKSDSDYNLKRDLIGCQKESSRRHSEKGQATAHWNKGKGLTGQEKSDRASGDGTWPVGWEGGFRPGNKVQVGHTRCLRNRKTSQTRVLREVRKRPS